ncbi:MAG: photosynthetic complex assembly protein PuhC [Xanthobacteraceae bacterium]
MHEPGRPFPRLPLFGAAALILFALVSIAAYRGWYGLPDTSEAAPVAMRELRFLDQPDGAVAVIDPPTEQVLTFLAPGTNGFVRATLRGLARARKRQDIGTEPPFRLKRMADGRLILDDPTTGRHVDLAAFGSTNAAAFARLLMPQSADATHASR